MDYLLRTDRLTKKYNGKVVVDGVSLHVKKGEIYGFIGRNGAGKTTFLKMIGGLASPTKGSFSFLGHHGREVRELYSRIGVLIENPGVYGNLTAYDNIKLKCLCAGVKGYDYIKELLELVGLDPDDPKKVKNFSLGMKQRLGIALAIVGEPDLLLLDEPINGLDPGGIVGMRRIIMRLNKERNMTIIISSHILEELSKIATNYGIIHQGKLIQELSRESLLERCKERIEISLAEPERACPVLEEMGLKNYTVVDGSTIYVYADYALSGEITMKLSQNRIPIREIKLASEDIESYFLSLTGGVCDD